MPASPRGRNRTNTYAALLAQILTGDDDSFTSAVERIFIATNGLL
jgi:hypothetical protein